ncbi:unnamed protein product [Mytilus edulis]|uniref:Uncharacterized protein n=1 Tax=Mytilus edulis TaxID=6550 RepID=A0A8S3UC21_MYTED|nr:unnamed protein product [Mytilus edulis]
MIIDMIPEECPRSSLKDTRISCIPEYESPPYYPVPRDRQTEDQKQIAHLQDFNSNIRQWLEECDTQDEVASSCSEEGACSSLEWNKRRLEQKQRRSEHLTMLEQLHCEQPQESLSSESLNSNLSVCSNEYRTPPPRINMVAQQTINSMVMSQMTECSHRLAITGDSDRSDVSAYRQTRNKRRSEPEYNRPREDQQRDFSPKRSVRSSPSHRSHFSSRSSRKSSDSQSESDTDGRSSESSQASIEKRRK